MNNERPGDLIEAKEAAKQFGIPYFRIRGWWARGRIGKYVRGDGRVLVRRSEVERMLDIRRVNP